jgi:hypothetical protein
MTSGDTNEGILVELDNSDQTQKPFIGREEPVPEVKANLGSSRAKSLKNKWELPEEILGSSAMEVAIFSIY